MPNYCYERPSGEIFERAYSIGEAPDFLVDQGQTCNRSFQAEIVSQSVSVKNGNGHVKRAWPMPPCVGSGVHASDGPKLAKFLKDHGCPTEVVDGDPIYTSAAHRRKALKCRGLRDNNAHC